MVARGLWKSRASHGSGKAGDRVTATKGAELLHSSVPAPASALQDRIH